MENWIELKKDTYNEVWNRFYTEFEFKPSIYEKDWPTFKVSKPYITYDISNSWRNCTFEEFEFKYYDLHKKVLQAFIIKLFQLNLGDDIVIILANKIFLFTETYSVGELLSNVSAIC